MPYRTTIIMNILFLSRWYPYPPNNGSKLRIYNLLRGLSQQHQVTLISFADDPESIAIAPEMKAVCKEIHLITYKPFNPASSSALLGFFKPTPRSIIDTFSEEMKNAIEQAISRQRYNVVIASQIDMAVYGRYLGALPAIFEEAETGVLYEQFSQAGSLMAKLRYGLTWFKYQRYLRELLKKYFRLCTVASGQERRLLANAVGSNIQIEIIPNGVDATGCTPVQQSPQPNTLIFTGSLTFSPNHQAMVWFIGQVFPLIHNTIPEARLIITGDHANKPLPSKQNVILTGMVEDVRSLVAQCWVSVAPIFSGGGTRLKILEAMALGTPVIATSKGAEGLNVEAGRHLLIADTPQAFADAAINLLQQPQLRRNLADEARQLILKQYDWSVITPRLLDIVEAVVK